MCVVLYAYWKRMAVMIDFRWVVPLSLFSLSVRHRVQKTGKSRSLKKFGYKQEIALLFRHQLLSTSRPLVTALDFTLEYVPLV